MTEFSKGDYVLATKYSDGDPGDHWCVGFFDSMLPKISEDRYMVTDNDGKQFRGNGFRRCQSITHEQGRFLVENQHLIDTSQHAFYYTEDGDKVGLSLWDWLDRAPVSEGQGDG